MMSSSGTIDLPPDVLAKLHLQSGSRFTVTVEAGKVILQPIPTYTLDELRDLMASDMDVVAAIHEERRQDKW